MKKILWAVVFVGISAAPFLTAQTAKVIPLTSEEAQLALRIKNAKDEVLKDEATLKSAIIKRHGLENANGWYGGFEYSEDFKYIVPAPYTSPSNYCNNYIGTTLTTGIYYTTNCCPSSWVNPVYTNSGGAVTIFPQGELPSAFK